MRRTSPFKALLLFGLVFSSSVFADKKESTANSNDKAQPVQEIKTSQETNGSENAQTASAVTVPPGAPLLSATCTACHAADGNTDNPAFPKLSGLAASYIVKELQEFKKGADGKRNNAVMLAIANQLSDKEMDELAEYYAKQVRVVGMANATNIQLGRRIYRAGNLKTGVAACSACHAPSGEGSVLAGFPRLSGQNAEYIAAQLHAFKSGDRANDHNGIMQGIAAKMTDEEIEAVSNYVSGLH